MGLGVLYEQFLINLHTGEHELTIGLPSASMSACVRLKYTVALTSQSNYLYSVTNVVIWGFAENALGMIVGNVATLRPLFRVLRDRKTSSNNRYNSRGYYSSQRTGPANMYSRNYELAEQGKHTNKITTTSVPDHTRRPSQMSYGDSQKQILAGGTPPGDTDILVSRQVIVAYD